VANILLKKQGGGGGAETFLALSDTPSSYSGQTGQGLRVNAGEDALEFFTIPAGSTDEKVAVDSASVPGYLGAASSDGVLRTDSSITYTDGGDFVTLSVAVPAGFTVVPVSSTPYNVTATTGHSIYLVDATGGAITINLPTAVSNTARIDIKKIDSSVNAVTIDGDGGETIDGELTAVASLQYENITHISDNTNWMVI